MNLLEGKTALITGGARGIGKAICRKFAQNKANIAFTDITESEEFKNTEHELIEMGIQSKGYVSDASKLQDSQKTVEQIVKDFGSIDVLVNNAGITKDTLLMRMTEDQWNAVISVNLNSVFNLTKSVQRTMLKQRAGSIINMSSVVGIAGNAGQSNYAASKAGIIGFTKSIARELGSRNIRSNAIAPGFIITEMTGELSEEYKQSWLETIPLKRAGTAEDVANVTLFLASDLSTYVNGQVIQVCGGMNT